LNQLISEILNDLEVLIQQQSAVVSCANLPMIEGMKVQLQQLFQNLIANSLKFVVKGRPPIITIECEMLSNSGVVSQNVKNEPTHCRIILRDNGIGFDEKYQDKIFQIFQRLHGKSEYEGTGIGLALCKKIVENHKGTIVANGVSGEGATFIITLPLKQNSNQNEPNEKVEEIRTYSYS
ncbi:MAG: ATP-binding protein, partial [Chitinophagales bacterium]